MINNLDHFVEVALKEAHKSQQLGEVPVGAALFDSDGQMICSAGNQVISTSDPSAHAEIVCLREGGKKLNNYRLTQCTLAVTLEPCAMCAGAIMHARIARLIFGAYDPKTGVCGSVTNLFAEPKLNHHTQVFGGIKQQECQQILTDFFKTKRK